MHSPGLVNIVTALPRFACSIHAIWRPSFSQALYFELPMLPMPHRQHRQHRQLNVGRWVFIYVPWCLDVIYDCLVGSIDQKNVVWFRPALVDHYLIVTYDCSVGLIDCKTVKTWFLTPQGLDKNASPRFGECCNCSALLCLQHSHNLGAIF